jgi:hypothetical protein
MVVVPIALRFAMPKLSVEAQRRGEKTLEGIHKLAIEARTHSTT